MLKNTKLNSRQSGFTIVELLIVIVVIAILAAITIVAYNGIQNRAKASSAQSLANAVVKKAEAFNTIESAYPTYSQFTSNTGAGTANNSSEAKLDNSSQVTDGGATTPVLPSDEKTVAYKKCTTGAQIVYWSATAPSGNTTKRVLIGMGGAASTSPDATSAPTICS